MAASAVLRVMANGYAWAGQWFAGIGRLPPTGFPMAPARC
jgi:hypothetical protein